MASIAVWMALSLFPFAVFAPASDHPAPSFERYRFRLEGEFPRRSSPWSAGNISLWRDLAASLSTLKMAPSSAAAAGESRSTVYPWTGIGSNALGMFKGSNAIIQLSAVAGTLLIVESGLDTQVHNYFARNTSVEKYTHSGVAVGSLLPLVLSGGLLGGGLIGRSSELASAGSAVLQASVLAVAYTTTLKALTGRSHPGDHDEPVIYSDNEASKEFRFGFLRGGVYWGWPSGHMLSNTAAVTSLMAFYKDKTWLKVAGGGYLGFLFLSVISHGHSSMHWFSDAVAGMLMGAAIGLTVGRDFRKRWEGDKSGATRFSVSASPPLFSVSFSFAL